MSFKKKSVTSKIKRKKWKFKKKKSPCSKNTLRTLKPS